MSIRGQGEGRLSEITLYVGSARRGVSASVLGGASETMSYVGGARHGVPGSTPYVAYGSRGM